MFKRILVFSVILLMAVSLAPKGEAAIPPTINFQGRITDSGGNPITGNQTLKFELGIAMMGFSSVWNSGDMTVPLNSNGLFDVTLSGGTPALDTVNFSNPLLMRISRNGDIVGIQPLASVPYAFRAAVADSLADGGGAWEASGDNIYRVEGNVGIGTDDPSSTLHVVSDTNDAAIPAVMVKRDSEMGNAIWAQNLDSGSKSSAIYGLTYGENYGVSGRALGAGGGGGVKGQAIDNYGVYGSGNPAGVYGKNSTDASVKGYLGYKASMGPVGPAGVFGEYSSGDDEARGYLGVQTIGGLIGVSGSSNSGSGIGGYFYGSENVGLFAQGGKVAAKGELGSDQYTFGALGAKNPRKTSSTLFMTGTVKAGAFGQVDGGSAYGYLGYRYESTSSNSTYGLFAVGPRHYLSGNVGIGTTSPKTYAQLEVKSNSDDIIGIKANSVQIGDHLPADAPGLYKFIPKIGTLVIEKYKAGSGSEDIVFPNPLPSGTTLLHVSVIYIDTYGNYHVWDPTLVRWNAAQTSKPLIVENVGLPGWVRVFIVYWDKSFNQVHPD